jgi:SET domain-containing protein
MKKSSKSKSRRPSSGTAHHAHMRRAAKSADAPARASEPPYVVRQSRIHGRGVYATRRIRTGTRIVEYVGDRISHDEADARYEARADDDGHTFLFVVDDELCIDAGVGGNEARFINHKCDANCETVIEGRRVYIEAIRTIQPGEELGYDYQLTWESTDDPEELKLYACRCGAATCRGTMLDVEPLDEKRRKRAQARQKSSQKPVRSKPEPSRATTKSTRRGRGSRA